MVLEKEGIDGAGPPEPNTHRVVLDGVTGATTVAYFDGARWWLPGSETPWDPARFARRFRDRGAVAVDGGDPAWDVRYGRFTKLVAVATGLRVVAAAGGGR